MTDARTEILGRIRRALTRPLGEDMPEPALPSAATPYVTPPAGESRTVTVQGALARVGGKGHQVNGIDDALRLLLDLLGERDVGRAAVLKTGVLQNLDLALPCSRLGIPGRSKQ